jgi:hypothetical protein
MLLAELLPDCTASHPGREYICIGVLTEASGSFRLISTDK